MLGQAYRIRNLKCNMYVSLGLTLWKFLLDTRLESRVISEYPTEYFPWSLDISNKYQVNTQIFVGNTSWNWYAVVLYVLLIF